MIAQLERLGQWPYVGVVEVKCVRDAIIGALDERTGPGRDAAGEKGVDLIN